MASRTPGPPLLHGPDGMAAFINVWRTAFPDGVMTVDAIYAADDRVATRFRFEGTHTGPLVVIAPSGQRVTVGGMAISRVVDGQVVSHWCEIDRAGVMAQIDVLAPTAPERPHADRQPVTPPEPDVVGRRLVPERPQDRSQPAALRLHVARPARAGLQARRAETVLDVGCGGGLLAEEFASLGCAVTGVDPSRESLQTARAHAGARGLDIDYRQGTGEALPLENASFRVVYCCHVLEHVADVAQTLREIARVLEPGGLFMYDAINRTRRSKVVMIKAAQDWRSTAWAEPDLHAYDMFIRPRELEAHLAGAGLEVRDRVGLAPASGMRAFKAMWDRAHGKIGYAEMGARLNMVECRDTSSAYMGYATKATA